MPSPAEFFSVEGFNFICSLSELSLLAMDEENNPESPEESIEFVEDDFVEVVELDGEGETVEGTKQLYRVVECTWRFNWFNLKQSVNALFFLGRSYEQASCKVFSHCHTWW